MSTRSSRSDSEQMKEVSKPGTPGLETLTTRRHTLLVYVPSSRGETINIVYTTYQSKYFRRTTRSVCDLDDQPCSQGSLLVRICCSYM